MPKGLIDVAVTEQPVPITPCTTSSVPSTSALSILEVLWNLSILLERMPVLIIRTPYYPEKFSLATLLFLFLYAASCVIVTVGLQLVKINIIFLHLAP